MKTPEEIVGKFERFCEDNGIYDAQQLERFVADTFINELEGIKIIFNDAHIDIPIDQRINEWKKLL